MSTYLIFALLPLLSFQIHAASAKSAGVLQDCGYLLADLEPRRIDDNTPTGTAERALLYTVWSPDHSTDNNVHFTFPESGDRLIVETGWEIAGVSRFVGGWLSNVLVVKSDGTVLRQQLGADGRQITDPLPTTHYAIDPARARGIIAYAAHWAHVDDGNLLRALEFVAAELNAGALDDFRLREKIATRAYQIELGLDQ